MVSRYIGAATRLHKNMILPPGSGSSEASGRRVWNASKPISTKRDAKSLSRGI
jgi:hypothetical protein